jgi:two-component system cell cycle sensor histidine kinase/response regulator CckA
MQAEQPINILLVDDRRENLLALEAMLSPLGHNLVKTSSGEDALKELLQQDFAVILLDVQMPGMDGFETAELIRGRERSRHIPIIFLTAVSTSDAHIFQGYLVGAVDYLLKPIVPEILLSKVAVFVELYRKSDKIQRQATELASTVQALEYQIAERQRTEEALRQARDELEERVRERTAGLVAANEALHAEILERQRLEAQLLQAQKIESIGRLAGGVAHDFNNLLMAISGYSDLALDALPPDHAACSDLYEIQKAAQRAAALTRQLLAFARKQIIDPRTIDLRELIQNIHSLLQRLIGEDIELVIRMDREIGSIKADPIQIEQLLINLAVNARDAMPQGGKLTIESTNAILDEDRTPMCMDIAPGSYIVVLAVSDTGMGIPPEVQEHLFEPFFTTKEPGKGTGLGLATCYGIVKQHGGEIAFSSEVGQGTTFKIYLPRIVEDLDTHARHPEEHELLHGRERILLVEDESAVRELAARVLRGRGYTILEARNGEEALQLMQTNDAEPIQLLLTDVIMPRMGGRALAERLATMYPGLKVLFISGYNDQLTSQNSWLEQGKALLQKPFLPAVLARKVREVLDTSNETIELGG